MHFFILAWIVNSQYSVLLSSNKLIDIIALILILMKCDIQLENRYMYFYSFTANI